MSEYDNLPPDGLTETTEEDQQCYDECCSKAVSFTTLWKDKNNESKIIKWDGDWEAHLQHRQKLIDTEGRERSFPWKVYEEQKLKWLDGYSVLQLAGDCASASHRNSLKTSNLTNMVRTGIAAPEIAFSILYSIARGSGTPRFGNGCNLNPLSRWAAEVGNYLVADFGKYDGGKNVSKYKKGSIQDANALKHQSIIIHLPKCTFDYCYQACAAGYGITMGTVTYPTASRLNNDGVGVPSSYKKGGHAMALVAAMSINNTRYIYLENSHGMRYVGDRFWAGKQPGLWIPENEFSQIADTDFRYGHWYCNIMEL